MEVWHIVAILIASISIGGVTCQNEAEPSDLCIGCICDAASKCNRTVGCDNGMCGMFKITFPYWVDAGKPIISGDDPSAEDAWIRCVRDPFCAGQTVIGYMTKYRKDCNGDGEINCNDFAWLHHLGGFGCGTRALDKKYQVEFESCFRDAQVELKSGR